MRNVTPVSTNLSLDRSDNNITELYSVQAPFDLNYDIHRFALYHLTLVLIERLDRWLW